jgi:hypothetical protein
MHLTVERHEYLNEKFEEMKEHLGTTEWADHEYPELVLYSDPRCPLEGECVDEFNEIRLNLAKLRNLKHAVRTLIHEYTHYLEPRNGWFERYYNMGFTYQTHPYEERCREAEGQLLGRFYP